MTFLTAMSYVWYFMLAISGVGTLFFFLDWILEEHPIVGIPLVLIGGFLLLSFIVWIIGNGY